MKPLFCTTLIALLSLCLLTGCTTAQRRDSGMVIGGVAGGIAGSALTGGSTAGTIVGAIGGGYVGRQLAN